ncbi:hypothetical protein CO057_04215 [Candidatus Uhrbacteria bacterium CG_4_9_14_0_2_um_filter_41_50]|uniref:DUF948 domain-containing protein n=1 Tax=Candidatus Uhrbacteria bacterium CG_4_9_14_0_2_um_filter_41_50 TaxID=1975031 RepID=A0A2M8EN47_9BACT|nr:MAG: hypothetical protein COZ45_03445 [Candidatus Uhrbacteria bacterium CG_4_10_14_3_um_filter_41_21]PIZ55039.1 MAG: hypothetical protein COY24_01860 [Candidatus Uhrbacteria bacterium CG_4_10_14_0_2_um_filter_41_21]PJB84308.1 MAG: hypothetical protein CO086_04250 [Candidatus Uhrbacteria bacterium CG_4_9_14_0_8_um_filter_41_16]PJC24173.1 MAG: hypothetical protein CO057_04215 [Candidatus Uhrbacteria bacterium CG_4_9_14_0_2_um_filter_41_50]PJE75170.1 MAG: hypothetical protein COV03_01540 [Candi
MIETTDIFYIVLAFCVLWVTAFVCWFIYQITSVLKSVNDLMRELKWQVEKVEQALQGIKSKFELGSGHLSKLVNHVKSAADSLKDKN